jgi:hypothetical protein
MLSLTLLLLLLAAVCFCLAAANVSSKINLTALGLFFWIVTLLLR